MVDPLNVSDQPSRQELRLDRQHSFPVLMPSGTGDMVALNLLTQPGGSAAVDERVIQTLVQTYPACLPIIEIDAMFSDPVPICTELNTPAGKIDNFMVTPTGLPVLVECKLWRNPEARREVVGQILDYAKELSRWSSSDLQREVRHRLNCDGNPLLEMVRVIDPNVDERRFNDSLTANLRRGRFLLLIVGDGIREGVEAIAEYLQVHAGLHFSLGLIELPIYSMPNGDRLVVPRVLARTTVVTRNVVAVPDGYVIEEVEDPTTDADIDPERSALGDAQQQFWAEFLKYLKLDDPEQPKPKAARMGYITLSLPARTSWLTVYRDLRAGKIGIFLSSWRNTPGAYAMQAIVEDWDAVKNELGGNAELGKVRDGRATVIDSLPIESQDKAEVSERAFTWLAERVNTFVNVLRPRVRSAAADYQSRRD